MMNPSTYLREAERIENETAARIGFERLQRPPVAYSREKLATGCLLYRIVAPKRPWRGDVQQPP